MRPILVGRVRELQDLRRRMAEAAGGRGSLLLIGGEAGVGKTALLRWALRSCDPLLPISSHCLGPHEAPPFGPWLELAGALGFPFRPSGDWRPHESALAIAQGVKAAGRSLLFGMDDIQWADPASLDLLRHLAARLEGLPLLVVATYRSDEVQSGDPLWGALADLQRAGAGRLLLGGLSADEVADLTAAVLPEVPTAAIMARYLHERTKGHALFVTELLTALEREGGVQRAGGPLPETLTQAIDRHLERLSPGALRALQTAAIIGERFGYDLLAQVAEEEETALLAALDEACRQRVLEPEGDHRFRFHHALVREVLLQRTLPPGRRQRHRRIAEALLTRPETDPELLAFHLSRAGDARAVRYLTEAGDRAARLGAGLQAWTRYEEALALAPDSPGLLLRLGHLEPDQERARLRFEAALQAAEGAGEAGAADPAAAVWARHFLALHHGSWRADPAGLPMMEAVQAEQAVLLTDPRYRQLETALFGSPLEHPRIAPARALALTRAGEHRQAEALLRELEQAGTARLPLMQVRWWMASLAGRWEEAADLGLPLSEELQLRGDDRAAFQTEGNRLYQILLGRADQPDAVDEVARRVIALAARTAERSGFDPLAAGYPPLGWYQFLRGDWDGAEQNLLGYLRQNPHDRDPGVRGFAVLLQQARGDLAGARATLAVVPPFAPDDPPGLHTVQVAPYIQRAELHLTEGDREGARAWLQGGERLLERRQGRAFRSSLSLAWARFHLAAGDPAAARAKAEAALTEAGAGREFRFLIGAHRLLGSILAELGEAEPAEHHFREAIGVALRCRFPYEAALGQAAFGQSLPSAPGALEALTRAREVLAGLRAAPRLAEVEGALARAVKPGSRLPDGLSAREAEVIHLVAQGLTDKEVAARLFLSPRTVDNHLRRIFSKAGVNSRAALVAYAARHRLID